MSEDDDKSKDARSFREQIRREDFRESLRSSYKLLPNDAVFEDLLRRLEAAEKPK